MKPLLALALSTALLAGCAERRPAPPPAPPADGEEVVNVVLYRGLRLQAGSPNAIDWTRVSFGVSGAPPTLSLFDAMALPGIPCWMSVTVAVPAPVAPGSVGQLTIPIPPPGGANPGPWGVDFNDVPPGHWQIPRPTIGGASNNQSSAMAAAVLSDMVVAGSAQVHDGTAVGCH